MTDTPTSSALATTGNTSVGVFDGIEAFDAAQRMAKALSSSTLVPTAYQGQQGLANSLIALEMAGRMRLSPLVVMQNLSIIHGRPSWSSSFLIATVNASGRFTPLRFVFDDPARPTSCYAAATDKASGEELIGETITLEMAKREGWSTKNGSKWLTMPGQMLRYRAASFWTRVYCPEVSLGLVTQEEAIDVEPVSVSVEPAPASAPVLAAGTFTTAEEAVAAAVVEPEPEAFDATEMTQLADRAVERMAQLVSIRQVDDAITWAEKAQMEALLLEADMPRIEKAAADRRKFLAAPLTVAQRQTLVSALASDSAAFRAAFEIPADAELAPAITQRQHQEWANAQR